MSDQDKGTEPAPDLQALACEAQKAAEKAAVARDSAATAEPPRWVRGRHRPGMRVWGVVLWLAAMAAWGWQMRWHLMPGLFAESDLAAIMEMARADVDQALKSQGRLPQQLPSSVIASVVRYEVVDANANPPTYRLEGTLGSASQSWTNAK